jgi:hypothetical protein
MSIFQTRFFGLLGRLVGHTLAVTAQGVLRYPCESCFKRVSRRSAAKQAFERAVFFCERGISDDGLASRVGARLEKEKATAVRNRGGL